RRDAEITADRFYERTVQLRDMAVRMPEVHRLDPRRDLGEMGCATIVELHRFPVRLRPFGAGDLGLPDLLVVLSLDFHRHRQPLHALRRLDLVAVSPVAAS